ncbi:MAG: hypothetical protein AAFZ15_23390 [Bacteroidota bacterium]
MRKLIYFLSVFFSPLLLHAQTFSTAPKNQKLIKRIVEWTTFAANEEEPEETIKDAIYTFRRDGQLQEWVTNNTYEEVYQYEYDQKNRLINVNIEGKDLTRTMSYQYFPDRRMAEIQERDIDVRTIQYLNNKGQIIEEKSFWKGELSEGKWATMSRTVFNYNELDSVFGEMRYEPVLTGQINKFKTVHKYDGALKKKIESIYYEADGQPFKIVKYDYNSVGKLLKKVISLPQAKKTVTEEHIYRNGKIWQSITKGADYRQEKVFKNGRLVRSKEYDKNGQLLWHTDYQYIFF